MSMTVIFFPKILYDTVNLKLNVKWDLSNIYIEYTRLDQNLYVIGQFDSKVSNN